MAVIFSEDFEVADMNALVARGWEHGHSSNPSTTDIVTMTGRTGAPSKVLRQRYLIGQDGQGSEGLAYASYITKTFSPVSELYMRFYMRWETANSSQPTNWTSPAGAPVASHKIIFINQHEGNPNFILGVMPFGDNRLELANPTDVNHQCPGGNFDITCNLNPNINNAGLSYNTWHCIEYHVTSSMTEIWLDNVLTQRYTTNVIGPSTFQDIIIYRQSAINQIRYCDDVVISTSRITCAGSPPVDTTAPAIPTGLTVQ